MELDFEYKIYDELDHEIINDWTNQSKKSFNYCYQDLNFLKNYIDTKINTNSIKFIFITVKIKTTKELVFIFPLEIVSIFGFKILQWLGTKDFDYCGPIITSKKVDEKQFQCIWSGVLNSIKNIDVIFFSKQPEYIEAEPNPFVKFLLTDFYSRIFLIKIQNSFKEYLSSIKNKKFLKELLRSKKKLEEENKVDIKFAEDSNSNDLLNSIIDDKILQLRKSKKFFFINKENLYFYKKLYQKNKQIMKISALYVNKKIVAGCLSLIFKERLYYLIPIIFNHNFRKYSPGKILIYSLIHWSHLNNYKFFDFGLGEEKYKKYWSNKTISLYRYIDYNSPKGFLVKVFLKSFFLLKFLFK